MLKGFGDVMVAVACDNDGAMDCPARSSYGVVCCSMRGFIVILRLIELTNGLWGLTYRVHLTRVKAS